MIYAVAIYGSPRRGGNSDLLLDSMIKGMEKANAKVDRIYASEVNVAPCDSKRECESSGLCCIKDDMQKIYRQFQDADLIVLSTPIYFYAMTAQAKTVIDRCQSVWSQKYLLKKETRLNKAKEKWGFLLCTAGAKGGQKLFDGAILTMKFFLDAYGALYKGEIGVRGVDKKGEITDKFPEAIHQAYEKGVELAEGMNNL